MRSQHVLSVVRSLAVATDAKLCWSHTFETLAWVGIPKSLSPCSTAGAQFVEFIERHSAGHTPVLVAHNGKNFDLKLLYLAAARGEANLPSAWLWADSMLLAKQLKDEGIIDPPRHSQGELRQYFMLPALAQVHCAGSMHVAVCLRHMKMFC